MSKRIAVVDGNSLMHRAYHAVPPTMNAPDGTPTNAIFGFLSMLIKYAEAIQPDAIICAFDAGKPAFRLEALEQYKAQRPPMDQELRVQFPVMEELLECMNIPVVKVKGWEGDDILGTIAARNEQLGYETLLITGDKDAYQLVNGHTRIATTKKANADVLFYGPDEVFERYGVHPDQFIDFLGLMGDSVDNIPGVPGIGEKTAAKLLARFGSMDGIYEHLDELKGKQLENLRDNRDQAYLSREVATIVCDVDFPLDIESAKFPDFDTETLTEGFTKYRLFASMNKLISMSGGTYAPKPAVCLGEVLEASEAQALIDSAIRADKPVAVAYEQSAQESLFARECLCFAVDNQAVVLEDDAAKELLAHLIRVGRFVAHEAKELLHLVYPADSALPALVSEDDLRRARFFDVSLAAYMLDSSAYDYKLGDLLQNYASGSLPEEKDERANLVLQARALQLLVDALGSAMKKDDTLSTYENIDLPLVAVLTIIERTGTEIDVEHLAKLSRQTAEEIVELKTQIFQFAKEEFNLDSPKQLAHILFEVLGLHPTKKTQRGYSTDASVLKELAHVHELPALVLRYRELAKLKSTYLDALPRLRAQDGRVHTTFNQTVTTTGRLSSSDPNLQNIPVRSEFGRTVRECFIPLEAGEVFLSADYSQIELRLLAHLSEDEGLIEAFCSGMDFHAHTAARVFNVSVDEVTPELRSRAKAVNFGIVYGQQAYGLAQSLEIPFGEAKEMIDRYFAAYPKVRSYLDETIAEAKRTGFALTMFGRKRHIPELRAAQAQRRSFGERTAMNHPMQGSAADIIKLAMAEVDRILSTSSYQAKLLLQVHDELDFSVAAQDADQVARLVKEAMEDVVELKVPLVVDAQWGKDWSEAH